MSHHGHGGRSAAAQFFMEGEYGDEDEEGMGSYGRRSSSSSLGSMPSRHGSSRNDPTGFEASDYQDENEVNLIIFFFIKMKIVIFNFSRDA